MRYGRALVEGEARTFLVDGDTATILPAGAPTPDDLVRGERLAELDAAREGAPAVAVGELSLLAPLTRFGRDVLCTGWNYWDHFEESHGKREGQDPKERPKHPTFFTKAPLSITGPTDAIDFDPELSARWDYEAELAIVIGRRGRSIPEDKAMDHIAGLLVANDVSQRDLQRAHGGQWFKGKSIDAGSPMGPWVTTLDEVDDVQNLRITMHLNGEIMQDASTAQMAFSIPQLIAELSRGMTLMPGDVLLTGTPSGIGHAREPAVLLAEGDELVTTVEGLGELRNTMKRADLTSYQAD